MSETGSAIPGPADEVRCATRWRAVAAEGAFSTEGRGVQLLQKELSALKVFELQGIATELGVVSTGLKTELQERLSTYFSWQDSGDESNIFKYF